MEEWETLERAAEKARARGDRREQERLLGEAVERARAGLDSTRLAISLNNLAVFYRAQERFADADPLLEEVMRIWSNKPDCSVSLGAGALDKYAKNLRDLGREDEAALIERRAREAWARLAVEDPEAAARFVATGVKSPEDFIAPTDASEEDA